MIDGYDAVLLDNFGDYMFLEPSFAQLRTAVIWMHNITEVSGVTFELDGENRYLKMEHGEEDSITGWLDGIELSENNVRRLFMAALYINQNGETDEPIPIDDFPVYRISMEFVDRRSLDMLELYQLTDSQFLIVRNGQNTGLFITRMSLQEHVLNRFITIDAGLEIPM